MSDAYAIKESGGTYFLTCTVVGWVDIFTRERYRRIITDSLTYCRHHKNLELNAWVLMTNHLHWIATVPHDVNMSDVIRDFKKHTSRIIIDSLLNEEGESRREWLINLFRFAGRNNPDNKDFQVWRKDNRAIVLYNQNVFIEKLNYIHQNPGRAGWVHKAEDYIYSSADVYAGERGLIDIDPIIVKEFIKR